MTLLVLAAFGAIVAAIATTRSDHPKVVGNPTRGMVLFKGYCAECHTMKAAGARGHFGPNLDTMKPTYAQVVHQIETGGTQGAGLPPTARLTFGPGIHTFSASDIHDIAAFVSSSAG